MQSDRSTRVASETAADLRRYSLLRRHVAEKKIVAERAEAEYCEASFYWKNKVWTRRT